VSLILANESRDAFRPFWGDWEFLAVREAANELTSVGVEALIPSPERQMNTVE